MIKNKIKNHNIILIILNIKNSKAFSKLNLLLKNVLRKNYI